MFVDAVKICMLRYGCMDLIDGLVPHLAAIGLRSGAKGLTATAVYPKRYGQAVASYHKKYVATPVS